MWSFLGRLVPSAPRQDPITIDLTKTKFNPKDGNHVAAINSHIKAFNDAFNNLYPIDIALVCIAAFLWECWSPSVFIDMLIFVAYLFARQQSTKQHSGRLHEELEHLVKIYERCLKDHGEGINQDQTISLLLATIVPFVRNKKLLIGDWNMPCMEAPSPWLKLLQDNEMVQQGFASVEKYVGKPLDVSFFKEGKDLVIQHWYGVSAEKFVNRIR